MEVIGQGGSGEEKLAHHLLSGLEVAVKVLPGVEQNFPSMTFKLDLLETGAPRVIQLFQDIER